MQKHSEPQVIKSRNCIPNARHKVSPCGTDWIKFASSQSQRDQVEIHHLQSTWRGGWWDRFCRAVREPLYKVLGKALMKFTELNTLPVNIEGVFKTTDKDKALALIAVSDDHRVLSPITPAHLTIGRPLSQLPDVTGSLC